MKKFLVVLLAFGLCLSFASCKKEKECQAHVDADDDLLCDNCGESYDDGKEAPDNPIPEVTELDVTFTVKLESGEALSGVKIYVERGEENYSVVTDANGKASLALNPNAYSISYDFESLPEFCSPDLFGIKVEEGKTAFDITVKDNTPDGSLEKPFFIAENITEITLAPGQELYFNYRGSTVKTVTIKEDGISVSYEGESYSATDGLVEVVLAPEIGKITTFSVKNNTENEIITEMELVAPLGSNENPIEITDAGASVIVNFESVVYYKWVANKTGTLTLTSNSDRNNISVTKVMENDVSVVVQTNGDLTVSMAEVNEGDVITIAVSALEANKNHENQDYDVEISFSLSIE